MAPYRRAVKSAAALSTKTKYGMRSQTVMCSYGQLAHHLVAHTADTAKIFPYNSEKFHSAVGNSYVPTDYETNPYSSLIQAKKVKFEPGHDHGGVVYGLSFNPKEMVESHLKTMGGLYQEYRVRRIKFFFIPTENETVMSVPGQFGADSAPNGTTYNVNSATSSISPQIWISTDKNDIRLTDVAKTTASQTILAFLDRDAKMYGSKKMFTWTVNNPGVRAIGTTAATNAGEYTDGGRVLNSPWMKIFAVESDVTSVSNIQYNGVKMYIQGPPNALWSMRVFARVDLDFRGQE